MMNIDQARVGEGVISSKKKPSGKDKNVELDEAPSIFESDEKPLKVAVPDGWSVRK